AAETTESDVMSAPGMWWGPEESGAHQYAIATCDIAAAPARGWLEALCGYRLPEEVELLAAPTAQSCCLACVIGATADLGATPATLGGVALPALTDFAESHAQAPRE
ncbi:MAG: hypothetical protein ACRDTC_09065, partial [Pseudonocardiaceae bacterium]